MSVTTAEARLGAVSSRPLALRATAAGERKGTYLDININDIGLDPGPAPIGDKFAYLE